ncbi:MAG: hypothetical protein ABJN65_12255 [Parasphingorhabdus sp.]
MIDKEKPDALHERELDQVTGGAGHELSHTVQQGGGKFAVSTGATSKGATAFQYNPETITRTVQPSGCTGGKD